MQRNSALYPRHSRRSRYDIEKRRATIAVAGTHLLHIPAKAAILLESLDFYTSVDFDILIGHAPLDVRNIRDKKRYRIPSDINSFPFNKFVTKYFQNADWTARDKPISQPLLSKTQSIEDAIALFALVLRFMNDTLRSDHQAKHIADYILQMALSTPDLRDELIAQLVNQVWRISFASTIQRGWHLLSLALAAFKPSSAMYNYILKHVSDNALDEYKAVCQHLLLNSVSYPLSRSYPPTLLEWVAMRDTTHMSLLVYLPDSDFVQIEVHPWSTCEDVASRMLQRFNMISNKNLSTHGWSIVLLEDGKRYEMAGDGLILDLIGETELAPGFPFTRADLLASYDKHNAAASDIDFNSAHAPIHRLCKADIEEVPSVAPGLFKQTQNEPLVLSQFSRMNLRSPDHTITDNQLSRVSKLNQRYGAQTRTFRAERKPISSSSDEEVLASYLPKRTNRSVTEVTHTVPVSTGLGPENEYLSPSFNDYRQKPLQHESLSQGSKLNRRYIGQSVSQQKRKSVPVNSKNDGFTTNQSTGRNRYDEIDVNGYIDELFDFDRAVAASSTRSVSEFASRIKGIGKIMPPPEIKPHFSRYSLNLQSSTTKTSSPTSRRRPISEQPVSSGMLVDGAVQTDDPNNRPTRVAPVKSSRTSVILGLDGSPKPIQKITGQKWPPPAEQTEKLQRPIGKLAIDSTQKAKLLSIHGESYRPGQPRPTTNSETKSPVLNGQPSAKQTESFLNKSSQLEQKLRFGNRPLPSNQATTAETSQQNAVSLPSTTNDVHSVQQQQPNAAKVAFTLPDLPPPPPDLVNQYAEIENIKTRVHSAAKNMPFLTYITEQAWQLRMRKEVFLPSETISNRDLLDFLFCQIVYDAFSPACIRFVSGERQRLRQFLENNGISPTNLHDEDFSIELRMKVVEMARTFALYFARFYSVTCGSPKPNVHLLAVSHSAVCLVQRVSTPSEDRLVILERHLWSDISDIMTPRRNTLQIHTSTQWLTIYSDKMPLIRRLIEAFLIDLDKTDRFVISIQPHFPPNTVSLGFTQGTIIKTSKRMNAVLERGTMYGAYGFSSGTFPAEYVTQIDYVQAERIKALRNPETRLSIYPTSLVPIPQTEDLPDYPLDPVPPLPYPPDPVLPISDYHNHSQQPSPNAYQDNGLLRISVAESQRSVHTNQQQPQSSDLTPRTDSLSPKQAEKLVLYEFAVNHFNDKPLTDKDFSVGCSLCWTMRPIKRSLIKFSSPKINDAACESFLNILKFMGDSPPKAEHSKHSLFIQLLELCNKHWQLVDELFCQTIRQLTRNISENTSSLTNGWHLLFMLMLYLKPSYLLRPYVKNFILQQSQPDCPADLLAQRCSQLMGKCVSNGRRKTPPGVLEFQAREEGQKAMVYLAGELPVECTIRSDTLVSDIIAELCTDLGITAVSEFHEYDIFVDDVKSPSLAALPDDYILDLLQFQDLNKKLVFRRTIWHSPVNLKGSQKYLDFVYLQIVEDYLNGRFLLTIGDDPSNRLILLEKQLAKLVLMQLCYSQITSQPSDEQVLALVPVEATRLCNEAYLLTEVQNQRHAARRITKSQARQEVLEILTGIPTFGVSRFTCEILLHSFYSGPAVLTLGMSGLQFYHTESMKPIDKVPLRKVLGSRVSNDNSTLDFKIGDFHNQSLLRISSNEVRSIIGLINKHLLILSTSLK